MNFQDFLKNGQARRATPDLMLADSLIKTSEVDLKFLKTLEINENSARKVISNYYDVLRSILEAIVATEGYKVYSHEAFTFFLKDKGEDSIAEKFDRFRRIRNGINYYGKGISVDEAKAYVPEMVGMIALLRKKYLKRIN